MSQPINLNKVRKARARADANRRADDNAAFHGLSKAEKAVAKAEAERARKKWEAGRREDDEE